MAKYIYKISKYRQALMGVAILGVMIGHCKTDWPETIISQIVGVLCYSVFTGGFLFLSGFGLYFSLTKTPCIKDYYLRRLKRVIIPWICIAFPYFGYMDLVMSNSWSDFFWHTSTLAFWKDGNYSGMWYISVILVLYCIYPIYHKFIFNKKHKFPYSLLSTIVLLLLLELSIYTISPDYYEKIKVCMNLSIFFIGAEIAHASLLKRNSLTYNLIVGGGF